MSITDTSISDIWTIAYQHGSDTSERNAAMAIRAVVFDLGGMLENEIETGMDAKWEARLNLKPGELNERLLSSGLARDATVGKLSEEEMFQKIGELYGMDRTQVHEFMNSIPSSLRTSQACALVIKQPSSAMPGPTPGTAIGHGG